MAPLIKHLNRSGEHNVERVTCERDDVGGLVERVLESGPLVVVCWEHDALIAWLHRLAGMGVVVEPKTGYLPCEWDGDRFDVLWRLRFLGTTTACGRPEYEFSTEPQNLAVTDEPVSDKNGAPVGSTESRASSRRDTPPAGSP